MHEGSQQLFCRNRRVDRDCSFRPVARAACRLVLILRHGAMNNMPPTIDHFWSVLVLRDFGNFYVSHVRFRQVLRVSPYTFSPINHASIPPAVCALGCTDLDRLSSAPIATVAYGGVSRSTLAYALCPSAAETTANMTKLTSARLDVGLTLSKSCLRF